MRVFLTALGCKLNQSEVESLARDLAGRGHRIVTEAGDAEVIVLNTCAVTQVAARKSAQLARRLSRAAPGARLVVTGCFAELSSEEAAALPGSPVVVGNRDKERLVELLGEAVSATPNRSRLPGSRTRAWVKIQDGCDNECSYCVVRLARGRQRSRVAEAILDEIRARVDEGYREVVLTGVHIGGYGRDGGATAGGNLWSLVRRALRETDVARLRLSSIEPWDIAAEDVRVWDEEPRLCRHLHLPVQSGSDAVLARMKRRYTVAEFETIVAAARTSAPAVAVTTDIIVGFPGETETEWEETLDFVRRVGFARLHVFPYSRRPGTPAAGWADQVPVEVKRRRAAALMTLGQEQAAAFRRQFIGQTLDVLWETRGRSGEWSGLTDNYIRVCTRSDDELRNRISEVRMIEETGGGLRGEILPLPHSINEGAVR